MAVEIRPLSGRLGLNLCYELFFTFKNHPSQSYGPYNRASIAHPSINKKTFSRSGGFCYDSASNSDLSLAISHCDDCYLPTFAQPLRELPTLAILFFFVA
jgi:hypothetical protein